jgi:hypothetical protein
MKSYFGILFSVFFFTLCGCMTTSNDDFWTAIAARKDVEITTKNGLRTANFSGDVVIYEQKNGEVWSTDNSELGAVMCAYMIYSETNILLNTCFKNTHSNFKVAYGAAVARIKDFIVLNSITPITKTELDATSNRMFEEGHKGASLDQICASDFLPQGEKDMSTERMKEFEQEIDKLLSVPRPPVMEPCL